MPQRFDVAIAGSGPAGAACALRLARSGYTVALIDPRHFPRKKLCGEYVNLGAIEELGALGLADDLEPLASPIEGVRICAHGADAAFAFPTPAWALPRTLLDDRIRAEALHAGAAPILAHLTGIEHLDNHVRIALRSDDGPPSIEATYLVGADGIHSSVARLLDVNLPARNTLFATGGHCEHHSGDAWLTMYVGAQGYFAINPFSSARANAMFVVPREWLRDERLQLDEALRRFAHEATGLQQPIVDDAHAPRLAVGPLHHRTSGIAHDRVLLVGDAAAFVDPFTGQGIFLALAGARLAAKALVTAFETGSYALPWHGYERALRQIVRERERVAALTRFIVGRPALATYVARKMHRNPHAFGALVEIASGRAGAGIVPLARSVARAVA